MLACDESRPKELHAGMTRPDQHNNPHIRAPSLLSLHPFAANGVFAISLWPMIAMKPGIQLDGNGLPRQFTEASMLVLLSGDLPEALPGISDDGWFRFRYTLLLC